MNCDYFEQGKCRSCTHIQLSLAEQVANKQQRLVELMSRFKVSRYDPPIYGDERGFRNKAKMVVLGSAHQPKLGILSRQGEPISLVDCALYPSDMQALLLRLQLFVQQAGIPPYRIDRSKGELKFILLTRSQQTGEFLLRFVLRSTQAMARIQRELPNLLTEFTTIKVVSVNIQPVHMAVLEGEEEHFLTEQTALPERFNDVPLYIRPKSFFQTNPYVAARLYQTAHDWVTELNPSIIWDLFCGVGGFGLHCATAETQLVGIEIEAEAIACAQRSAQELGLKNVSFRALASDDFASQTAADEKPELIIVNPPRRGLGTALCQSLSSFAPQTILYSSCNVATLIGDLEHLPHYKIIQVQLFDMFAHSDHFEVLVMLQYQPLHEQAS